ncbi:MAG: SdpI family protein [Christensenellales bacterium]|jgi:uncharacterized membrane protein
MMILLIAFLLFIPLIFLAVGLLFRKHPPKEVNWAFGYRTRRSCASQQAWDFAHAYFAKVALRMGAVLLVATGAAIAVSMIVASFEGLKTAALYIEAAQLVSLWVPVFIVERKLRREFDEEGRPKNT